MGWRKIRVIGLILSEALMLAAAGAVAGVVSGVSVIFFLCHWHVTSGLVQGDISLKAIAEGISMAALMALAGAAYPAYRSASASPVESLRGA